MVNKLLRLIIPDSIAPTKNDTFIILLDNLVSDCWAIDYYMDEIDKNVEKVIQKWKESNDTIQSST